MKLKSGKPPGSCQRILKVYIYIHGNKNGEIVTISKVEYLQEMKN